MAPLVIAQDPDLTDSKEEKKEIQKSTESVQENNEQLLIGTTSGEASEIKATNISETSSLEVAFKNNEHSVQETSAVDDPTAKYIHPWDSPPAKKPVYPPGTYRGMF